MADEKQIEKTPPWASSSAVPFKRSHFSTQLPVDYLYSPSHLWIASADKKIWTIGLTKFATRMLGEMVDHRFEVEDAAPVRSGQILGWIEGFKAISDLYCIGQGRFVQSNPLLREKIKVVNQDCYRQGWLYQIEGAPDGHCVDVHGYVRILHKTIDKILEKQKQTEIE